MGYDPVTHVIFDCDGLLMDTERLIGSIMTEIVVSLGQTSIPHTTRIKLLGRTEADSINLLINDLHLSTTLEEFRSEFQSKCKKSLPKCTLMPGADRLVRHLASHGVPIAVATSSSAEEMALKSANHKMFFGLFHHMVMAGSDVEVKFGKPAPDIFLVCCSRFPESPVPAKVNECLVFEDAPAGVTGARAAGMQTVMVPAPDLDLEFTKHSTCVLKSLKDFVPEEFGLPTYCKCTT